MNEYEEAKDVLRNTAWLGTDNGAKVFDAIKIAIEALEKQIPMKVIDHDYCIAEYGDSGGQVGGIFLYKATCPTCNNTIVDGEFDKSDLMDIKFCEKCGQKLSWEEEE